MPNPTKAELQARVATLEAQLAQATAQNQAQTHTLNERVKELRLLYQLSTLAETRELALPEYLKAAVQLLPSGWQYATHAWAQIQFNGQGYQTANYQASPWHQTTALVVPGYPPGSVTVGYTEALAFLDEEEQLLAEVARLLSRVIERAQFLDTQRWLAAIIESSDDAIFSTTLDGHITSWNVGAERLYGYPASDMLGHSVARLITHARVTEELNLLTQVKLGQRVEHFETQRVRRDGRLIDVSLTLAPLFAPHGRIVGIAVTARSITDRKRAEAQRRINEERLDSLLTLSQKAAHLPERDIIQFALEEAVRLTDSQIGYLHCLNADQRTIELITWSANTLKQCQAVHDTHYPLDQAGVWADCARLKRPVVHNDYQNLPEKKGYPVGHAHLVRHLSVPILDEARVTMLIGVGNKTTPYDESDVRQVQLLAENLWKILQRKRAEVGLQESEARYRAVSEMTSDFAFAVRLGPREAMAVEWMTDAFTRITGYTLAELGTAAAWRALLHPADWPQALKVLAHARQGEPTEVDLRVQTRAGETRWVRVRSQAQRAAAVIHLRGAGQDITRYKLLEQQMLRSERLAAMGQIIATLAHEIKNPLQALQTTLELLTDFPLEADERAQCLQTCYQEVQHLRDITGSVLNLSRSGPIEHRPIDLADICRKTLELVQPALRKSQLHLTEDFPADLPPIQGVPEHVSQLTLNLLLNARESLPPGGQIHIGAHRTAEAIVLQVCNDGPPIPAATLEHIFEPFFTTKREGTGLGLFICYTYMQQHGGQLTAHNQPDGGVCFEARFPLPSRSASTPATSHPHPHPAEPRPPDSVTPPETPA